jgi:hypothetical protein
VLAATCSLGSDVVELVVQQVLVLEFPLMMVVVEVAAAAVAAMVVVVCASFVIRHSEQEVALDYCACKAEHLALYCRHPCLPLLLLHQHP